MNNSIGGVTLINILYYMQLRKMLLVIYIVLYYLILTLLSQIEIIDLEVIHIILHTNLTELS